MISNFRKSLLAIASSQTQLQWIVWIANNSWGKGREYTVRMTDKQMCRYLGITRRTFQRIKQDAIHRGLIERLPRSQGPHGGPRGGIAYGGIPFQYRMTTDKLKEVLPTP